MDAWFEEEEVSEDDLENLHEESVHLGEEGIGETQSEDDLDVVWFESEVRHQNSETPDIPNLSLAGLIDLNRAYIDAIARTRLLTAEEEIDLSERMLLARKASEDLASGRGSPKQRANLRKVIDDGLAARERLVLANTRLVISVAKRYVNRGLPFLDLVQEGIVGLIRATGKFDPHRGNRFSTFATWWIRQAITRSLDNQSRTIRIPVHITSRINKIGRAAAELEQEMGRPPTDVEIAETMGIDLELIEDTRAHTQRPISLETPQDTDENRTLADTIPDTDSEAPEETVAERLQKENIHEALGAIPYREAQVLRMRYGLNGDSPLTLHKVGQIMGITRERVRQIEATALRRLRKLELTHRLSDDNLPV